MFTKHQIDSHKVNYKDFIFDIRSFKFKPLNIYEKYDANQEKRKQEIIQMHEDKITMKKEKFEIKKGGKLEILDVQKQPFSNLEGIYRNGRKIGRIIKRYFPKQNGFEKYMAHSLGLKLEEFQESSVS